MKKHFLTILFLILVTFFIKESVVAASPTPTNATIQQQVNDLKNKIASRVAELNLVEKRGIVGTVKDSSGTQITLTDLNNNTRFVDVDELTNFSSSTSKSFGISDIKKGAFIGVLGLYNKQSRRILAREVSEISSPPKIIFGGIQTIDREKFEITVVKENGQKEVFEVEDITKTFSLSSDSLERSGFSKIKETQTAIIIGFPDKQEPEKTLATRIIILPKVDITNKINLGSPLNPTTPPSTGSGVKLYPITR